MGAISIFTSIEDINANLWNTLEINNPLNHYGWLKTIEKSYKPDLNPRYFAQFSSEHLLAVCTCYDLDKFPLSNKINAFLFGPLNKLLQTLGLGFRSCLYCGHIKGAGSTFVYRSGLSEKEKFACREDLISTLREYSKNKKSVLWFSKVPESENSMLKYLSGKGMFKLQSLPLCYMPVTWRDFKGYTLYIKYMLGKKHKDNVSNEFNRNRKEGVKIKELDNIDENHDRIHELFKMNFKKYNCEEYPYTPDFLCALKKNLPDHTYLYVTVKEEMISGAVLAISAGNQVYVRMIGIDHHLSKNDKSYFVLIFYNMTTEAVKHGWSVLLMGNSLYRMKRSRGCKIMRSYHFIGSENKVTNLFLHMWCLVYGIYNNYKIMRLLKYVSS